jgi:uncharacterized protein YhaN
VSLRKDMRVFMPTDDEQPATKGDLKNGMKEMRSEMKEMRSEMKAMERRMVDDLVAAIKANNEELMRQMAAFDDRYRDLPGRMTTVERELDEHRRDATAHRRRRKN